MSDEQPRMFGHTPETWAALPDYMKTHLLETNAAIAVNYHSNRNQRESAIESQLWSIGSTVIKLLLGLNAGALVAILAFLGSLISRASQDLWLAPLVSSLVWFFAGITFAVAAAILAFFTASAQAQGVKAEATRYEEPYVVDTAESAVQYSRANGLRTWAIGLAFVSFGAAGTGALLFLQFAVNALK